MVCQGPWWTTAHEFVATRSAIYPVDLQVGTNAAEREFAVVQFRASRRRERLILSDNRITVHS